MEDGFTGTLCSCPRGEALCHHIAALCLFAHYNISVTDKECSWSAPKKRTEECALSLKELHPPKQHYTATKRVLTNIEIEKFREDLGAAGVVGFSWLLQPEQQIRIMPTIPQIEDIIMSREFLSSTEKNVYFQEKCALEDDIISDIERLTVGQTANENWLIMRKFRLTASKFGAVLAACSRNKFPPSLFKSLLGEYNLDRVLAVQWGRDNEKLAISTFEEQTGFKVESCGLFLDRCGFLGASPDGICGDAIIEVKCPYKYRNSSLRAVLQADKSYVLYYEADTPILNETHIYYQQMQGQMYITKKEKCYLIIWTPNETETFLIEKDPAWVANIKILKEFYLQKLLPFIMEM